MNSGNSSTARRWTMPPESSCGATSSSRASSVATLADRTGRLRRRVGDPVAFQEILERLGSLVAAVLGALDARAHAFHVRSTGALGATQCVFVEDGAELGAARGQLFVCLLRAGVGERHQSGDEAEQDDRTCGSSHRSVRGGAGHQSATIRVGRPAGDRTLLPAETTPPCTRGLCRCRVIHPAAGWDKWGAGMTLRSTVRWMLGVGIAGLVAACGIGKGTLGSDPATESQASTITWTDGQPALSISCKTPGGCQSRAVALCTATGGDYTVLKMNKMPTEGDMSQVRGPASVVIRCS